MEFLDASGKTNRQLFPQPAPGILLILGWFWRILFQSARHADRFSTVVLWICIILIQLYVPIRVLWTHHLPIPIRIMIQLFRVRQGYWQMSHGSYQETFNFTFAWLMFYCWNYHLAPFNMAHMPRYADINIQGFIYLNCFAGFLSHEI